MEREFSVIIEEQIDLIQYNKRILIINPSPYEYKLKGTDKIILMGRVDNHRQ